MKNYETQYMDLVKRILSEGYKVTGRNGDVIKLPHQITTVDLSKEFPILNIRKCFWKSAVKELLWMFRDHSNDVTLLQEQGVHFWDKWVDENNTIGKSYGYQVNKGGQFDRLLKSLKETPQDRRMIVNLWNAEELDEMTLPPCVCTTYWDVTDGKLNCLMMQRSTDVLVGMVTDLIEYAFLDLALAAYAGLKPGILTHVSNNSHIYCNQQEGLDELLKREVSTDYQTCKVTINKKDDFYDYTVDDFSIEGYEPQGKIYFPVSE